MTDEACSIYLTALLCDVLNQTSQFSLHSPVQCEPMSNAISVRIRQPSQVSSWSTRSKLSADVSMERLDGLPLWRPQKNVRSLRSDEIHSLLRSPRVFLKAGSTQTVPYT